MTCSNCGTPNDAGRKFCKECGNALAITCPNCGAANSADDKFCGECGTALDARAGVGAPVSRPVGAPAQPSGGSSAGAAGNERHAERRLVSVLFADLVGFTTLSEGRDPEDTRELLSGYFDLARDVITRHGGTVEKFIGDAVMAIWGAPVAREDDAELAVRAALSLVDAVKGLGPGISARAGVLTGEAAVTLGATGEGMVAGDLVNTASRLQSVAAPDTVLVGESTERAANQAIAFEPAGDQILKGKAAPVPAFRALRLVAEVGGRNRTGALEAPFVGRDDDFRLLKDLFHATGREKRPRLVSVTGPAGIGKSRLAWEFSKYVDGIVEDTYWHAGRSPSYGEGVTFWALGEMIRRRAELLETDDESTTRAKIDATVRRWVPDETQQLWIEGALLNVLGIGEQMPGGRDELFAALRTFFERIAEKGNTVLLFEDLQWADSGLLDFIDHLLDWTKSLPIFVLTLSRPELIERRPDWGSGRRNFVSLSLEPLSDAAMNELLDGLVPGLNQAVKKTIISRADGIPLYAVETVRMLVAQGKLTERDGAYLAAGEIDTIAIPETLTALIAARLDGVGPDEKSVLQAAAVLGQSFSVEALEALSGRSAADLAPMLVAFTRREVLSLEADPRSPERGQYSFVQALIREVAYNQLARNERKQRHLAAARWFESLGDDELAGVLAEHYAAAYKHAPDGPEADALAGQARIALRGAAERAAKLGSHAQAARYLMQALELTDEPTEQAALLERAGNEETDIDAERGQSLFERAVVLYRSIGDLHGLARAAVGVSITMMLQQRPVDAAAMLEPVVAETSAIADEPEGVFVLSELVRAYANSRHPDALKYVDQVLQRAEELEMMPIIAEGLINRALVLGYAGRFYEPATILRGVLPITQKHGLVRSESRTLNNLSVLLMAEDISESERLLEAAVEMSRRTGALALLESFQAGEIYPLMLLGRFDEAKSLLAVLMEAELTVNNLEVYQVASMYYALIGDRERASTVLSQTRPVADAISLKDMQVAQLWTEAFVSGVIGNYDESYRAGSAAMKKSFSANAIYAVDAAARTALWMNDPKRAREAALAADELKFPGRVFKAMLAHARATADAMDGNTEQALASYRAVLRNYADLQLPLLIAWAKTDMAVAIGPSVPEAAAAADEARAMWADFGASGMLARMDEVMQRWPEASARRSEAPVGDAVRSPASA